MGYRDDREALLRRAEALEREAARLRQENAALAAERAALEAERAAERQARSADDERRAEAAREAAARRTELERRAARPARVTRPPVAVATPTPRERRRGRSAADKLADWALATTTVQVAWILGVPATIAGGMFALLWLAPTLGVFSMYVAPILAVAVVAGAGFAAARLTAIVQRRRLAAHDLPLDVAGYLALLGREHARKVVTARVTFTAAPAELDRDLIRRVVTGAVHGAQVQWEDDQLVVVSPALETSVHGKGGVHHRNSPIHRWYRRLERRALRPLARAFPMTSVRVS